MTEAKKQMTADAKKRILERQTGEVICPGCGEEIKDSDDLSTIEYVRTKRKTDIFFHTECFGNIWKE